MPDIIRLFVRNGVIGFLVAGVFVALLIFLNVNGLRDTLAVEERQGLAVVVLWLGNGSVFAALQIAWAVLTLPKE